MKSWTVQNKFENNKKLDYEYLYTCNPMVATIMASKHI
jgi:hypothetical protein